MSEIAQQIDSYLIQHRDTHLDELKQLLSIPSISTLSNHADDVRRCAEQVGQMASAIGFEHVELIETKRHPVVYADWLHAPGKPTVLVYGHYDVQPVDPLHLWDSPPFEPEIRDGKIYARGATDDKGQVFLHLKSFEALLKTTGELPVNVKLCIEGEEEIGSPHLDEVLAARRSQLAADVLVISDTPLLGPNQPCVCYGLRGLAALEVSVYGPNHDLHSGMYGGSVQNPVHALVALLATLHDKEGKVTVDGFYDNVEEITAEEKQAFAELPQDDAATAQEVGVDDLYGEAGFSTLERQWVRPTLELNGIYGGFQGEGTKTIIPSEAHGKISCRLVPNQDPVRVQKLVESHLLAHAPTGVRIEVTKLDTGKPYVTPFTHPAIQLAAAAYASAYGVPAAFTRIGGSIPIVESFSHELGVASVLMGFGLNSENMHAPNEHFTLENFDKGLRTLCYYWMGLPDALNA